MPLTTLLISGPSGGGKTTVARSIAAHALDRSVHHLRMRSAPDGHTNAVEPAQATDPALAGADWASLHTVTYTPERAFETLPEGLRAVRNIDRYGFVIIEADTDPAMRHAFPYDYRVFVMAPPASVDTIFRDPRSAGAALQQVMQDTAAFASEIFGLFDADGLDDGAGVYHQKPTLIGRPSEPFERIDISEAQIRQFLSSPLGAEIASRIQLQPEYHAMVESDVVVINTGVGTVTDALDQAVQRIEKLLARVRHDARRHSVLYWGDVADLRDPTRNRLLERFRRLFGCET